MMCLDGAERYRDLARYYYEFMEKEGAGKYITWMMGDSWPGNANYATMPELYKSIYPGDKYVDYHSMMLYANGENGIHFWSNYGDAGCAKAVLETGLDQNKCSWTDKWEEVIEPFWTQAMSVSPNKPVFITEGSVESVTRNPNFSGTGKYLPAVYETKDSSAWFNDFFTQIRTNPRYKNLAGWNYWQNSGFWDLGEPGSAASNQVRIDSGSLVPGMLASDDWKTETSNYPQNWPTSVRCGIFDANGTMTSEIKCTDFTPSMLGEQTINGSGEGPSNNNEQPSNCLSNCIATGKTTDQCNDQCATAGTGGETGNGTGCVGADCTAGNGETGNQSTCVSTCMAGGKTLDQCNVQCAAQ